jgi:hypothetical protein
VRADTPAAAASFPNANPQSSDLTARPGGRTVRSVEGPDLYQSIQAPADGLSTDLDGAPGGDLRTAPADNPLDVSIRQAAYFRAQARGFEPGYELDDWLWAEREVQEMATSLEILRSQT